MDDEQYEHIPWSRLIDEQSDGWKRIVYIVAGIVLAVAVGIVGVKWLTGPDHGETAASANPVPIDTAVPNVTVPNDPVPNDPNPGAASGPTSTTVAASEADLMAEAPPSDAEIVARTRAEWFVTDFFTVDGDPEAAVEIRQAFVDDAVIPDLPHEAAEPGGVSFVEWARAYRTETLERDRYAVDVAFRTVRLAEDGEYSRGPVHAVEIIVVVAEGEAGIADLPIPIVPPRADGLTGWSAPSVPATEDVITAAAEYAFLFDAEPEVLEASGAGDDWRAVVTIGDGSGIRWPLVIRSDAIRPAG
jgi:hypothetical protein